MGVLQYFQKFRVRVWKCCRTHRSSGYCGMGVQNSQKFRASTKNAVPVPRVLWHEAYRTHRTSGYGYDPTELTEVPGTSMKVLQNFQKLRVCGTGVQNLQKIRAGIKMLYPYPGYSGTVAQILQKFWVRVRMSHTTHRRSLYGYCLLYTSPSPRDKRQSRMPSSA